MTQDVSEKNISMVEQTILASAVATHDTVWMQQYMEMVQEADGITDRMRLDIAFSDKLHKMREDGVLTVDASTIRAKAEEIVKNNAPLMWYGLGTTYGDSLIAKPQK